jgi:hypothetical protein
MKWKSLVAAIVLGLLLIWPSRVTGQDDTSKLDTALAHAGAEKVSDVRLRNKDGEHRNWRPVVGHRDEFLREIGVTDEQLERIKELRTQLREDCQALRKTYHENFLATLNKKQRKVLEHKRLERNALLETRAGSANTIIDPTSWGTVKQDTE